MTGRPRFEEFAPAPELRPLVDRIWHFAAPFDPAPQPIVPDGKCELVIQLGAPYREVASGRVQPAIVFAGQLTRPLFLQATGPTEAIGVSFRPEAAGPFLRRPADSATDRRLDLADIDRELAAELRGQPSPGAVATILARRLAGLAPDPVVAAAVAIIERGEHLPLEELSPRQFQRRFRAAVGISPRLLRTIRRFRRVFDLIEHPQSPGWLAAALASGYFDQPQMARDFRRFVGCTATEWARQREGLATAMAEAR